MRPPFGVGAGPLRSKVFTQGFVALQWRALPYYYQYKLLLIAQAAAVVSPISMP